VSEHKESVQNGSASLGPTADAQDLPKPVGSSDGDYYGDRDDAAGLPDLHVRRVDPRDG